MFPFCKLLWKLIFSSAVVKITEVRGRESERARGRASTAVHRPGPPGLGYPPRSLSSSSSPPAGLSELLCSGQPKASEVYPQSLGPAGIPAVQSLRSGARRPWPPPKYLRVHRFNTNMSKQLSVESMNNKAESEASSFWKETKTEVSFQSLTT